MIMDSFHLPPTEKDALFLITLLKCLLRMQQWWKPNQIPHKCDNKANLNLKSLIWSPKGEKKQNPAVFAVADCKYDLRQTDRRRSH